MNLYYIRQILRGIKQKRLNSLIKVLGITLAFVPGILIWSFVSYESSYDIQFSGYEKIFRVIRNWQEDKQFGVYTSVPLLPALIQNFPEIETGTRIWPLYGQDVLVGDLIYNEDVILAVDSSFFNTFKMELLTGDSNIALNNPGSVVISKTMAENLYGSNDPIGKSIEFEGYAFSDRNKTFVVKGVFNDLVSNSHLKGDFLLSLQSFITSRNSNVTNHMMMTYIRLISPQNEKLLEQKLPEFMESFYGKEYYDYARSTYLLQPITDIHLNTKVNYNEYETAKGSYSSLYIFPALAMLIILIASFNLINLTVSESISKHKSFGINKLSGAGKLYFFRIYILESIILTLFAWIVSFFVLDLISPLFIKLIERDLDLQIYKNIYLTIGSLVFAFLLGIINGIYPAYIYSSKNIIDHLANKTGSSGKGNSIQRVFQISQFAICILLIAGSFVVFKQLNYVNSTINQSLNSDNILVINNADKLGLKRDVFKTELKKINGIVNVSFCDEIPGLADYSHWGLPVDSAAFDTHLAVFYCDYDYFSTLNMRLSEGRFFDPEFSTDNLAVVLNETAVKTLGWEDNPLGKRYRLVDTFTVVGVVKDIFFDSFHHQVIPQGFFPEPPNDGSRILIKFLPEQVPELMKNINNLWSQLVPDRDIRYNFLDKIFNFWYKTERKTGQLALILAAIAIFLSSLGLLALVLLSINSRTKEIGIRKVNGAKIQDIIYLLNLKYIKWFIAAFVIACPASYYLMSKWLQNFAYKTSLDWWVFVLAGFIAMAIAILTVSWESWKASKRNPVEALRYE
jgi:putative ABC transport system permease protein